MGRYERAACGEKIHTEFWKGSLKERDELDNVDGRMRLKQTLAKGDRRVLIGFT